MGGYFSDKISATNGVTEAEVIDMGSDVSGGCGQYINYASGYDVNSLYPVQTGGGMLGGSPVLCGGYCDKSDCGSSSGALNQCFYYDGAENNWFHYVNLTTPRFQFGHVAIDENKMWLSGKSRL